MFCCLDRVSRAIIRGRAAIGALREWRRLGRYLCWHYTALGALASSREIELAMCVAMLSVAIILEETRERTRDCGERWKPAVVNVEMIGNQIFVESPRFGPCRIDYVRINSLRLAWTLRLPLYICALECVYNTRSLYSVHVFKCTVQCTLYTRTHTHARSFWLWFACLFALAFWYSSLIVINAYITDVTNTVALMHSVWIGFPRFTHDTSQPTGV